MFLCGLIYYRMLSVFPVFPSSCFCHSVLLYLQQSSLFYLCPLHGVLGMGFRSYFVLSFRNRSRAPFTSSMIHFLVTSGVGPFFPKISVEIFPLFVMPREIISFMLYFPVL